MECYASDSFEEDEEGTEEIKYTRDRYQFEDGECTEENCEKGRQKDLFGTKRVEQKTAAIHNHKSKTKTNPCNEVASRKSSRIHDRYSDQNSSRTLKLFQSSSTKIDQLEKRITALEDSLMNMNKDLNNLKWNYNTNRYHLYPYYKNKKYRNDQETYWRGNGYYYGGDYSY